MRNDRYRINSGDETKCEKTNISAENYRTQLHEINGAFGNSVMTERSSDKCGEKEATGKRSELTKREIPWLKSLIVFCSNVSVLGLSYVANTSASAFRRSVWLLLVFVGAAFTAFQIQERVRYHFSYPVNVIIREEYSEEMIFPTVTICNENRVSLSKMTSLGAYCHFFKLFCLSDNFGIMPDGIHFDNSFLHSVDFTPAASLVRL